MKLKKYGCMFTALSMVLSMSATALAADTGSNEVWDELRGTASSRVTLEVVNNCDHNDLRYINNGDGTHTVVCGDCDEVIKEKEPHIDENGDGACDKCDQECEHGGTSYVPNDDGKTHRKVCDKCGDVLVESEDHEDLDGDKECDKCGALIPNQGPVLIATVPVELPMIMDQKGNVTVATSAEIQNHVQDKAIVVTDIQATAKGGWALAPMSQDLKAQAKGTKLLAMSFRGDSHNASGTFVLTSGNWNIGAGDALKLNMAAKMPSQAKAAETEVASVEFTLNWAGDANAATSNANTGAGDQAEINKGGSVTTPTDPDNETYAYTTNVSAMAGQSGDFTVNWTPISATIADITSRNPAVVTASLKGSGSGQAVITINALKQGRADIIVTLSNGVKMKLAVGVSDIDEKSIQVNVPSDKKVGDYLMSGDITVTIPTVDPDGKVTNQTVSVKLANPVRLVEGKNDFGTMELTLSNGKQVSVNLVVYASASADATTAAAEAFMILD